ncbi:MAG: glycosyltransferase family 4 protein [Dermatophilaceae bacterium]
MRVALCSTVVPFVKGGVRNIVEWLEDELRRAGHEVERVYLPEVDHRDVLCDQMAAFRWIDLSAADRVVCFRPQAHLIRHPHKILWFIHHLRTYYDLWGHPGIGPLPTARNHAFRDTLRAIDTAALLEAERVFTNSQVVKDRLRQFNGIDSEVLYPPLHRPERFSCRSFGEEVVYVSRIERHKRQHLLVEALAHTQTPVKVRLCGVGSDRQYSSAIMDTARRHRLGERFTFDNRWIGEDEKAEILADSLAVAYLPVDEDSYGYPVLEGAHSGKPAITASDAGGVLEFVSHGDNGFCTDPDPVAIAGVLDQLYRDRLLAAEMGHAARERVDDLGISWPRVIDRLMA